MLWFDAVLAYLHFTAAFVLFAFLSIELVLLKMDLAPRAIALLARMDIWYIGSAIVVLMTGLLRLGAGAKGMAFYLGGWPLYVKLALFLTVVIISIRPTLTFMRWRREIEHDESWRIPADDQGKMRRYVLIELHIAALIPLFATFMARGLR